jgi:hypothetical protein
MHFFADWISPGSSRWGNRARDQFASDRVPPMRVETMRTDPMHLAEKVVGERDTPSRGPIEATEQVETLSQAANPVLTTPPPVPRDA